MFLEQHFVKVDPYLSEILTVIGELYREVTMLVILAFIGVRFALHVSRQSGRALADECYTRK